MLVFLFVHVLIVVAPDVSPGGGGGGCSGGSGGGGVSTFGALGVAAVIVVAPALVLQA